MTCTTFSESLLEKQIHECVHNHPDAKHYRKRIQSLFFPVFIERLRSQQIYRSLSQEEFASATCAAVFSLVLNPSCTPAALPLALERCDTFSIQQVYWATMAYYRGNLPNTEKIHHLQAKSLECFEKKDAILSEPGCNLAQLPGVHKKIAATHERWEKNILCAFNQKDLWITQWLVARVMLIGLYRGAVLKGSSPVGTPAGATLVFDPTCAYGTFDPHLFLTLLSETEELCPYIFCHMEKEDFVSLAYAWVPALLNPNTRALLKHILEKHLPFDPEKCYLEDILTKVEKILGTCEHGKTSQGCALLIEMTWTIFEELKANISQQQWRYSVTLLQQIDGVAQHITNNPSLVMFRDKPQHERAPLPSKLAFCGHTYLKDLSEKRHTILTQLIKDLSPHSTFLKKNIPELYTSTKMLNKSYEKNRRLSFSDNNLKLCALLTQQSVLFKTLSLERCMILWHLQSQDNQQKDFNALTETSLDAEIVDLKTIASPIQKDHPFALFFPLQPTIQWTPWRLMQTYADEGVTPWTTMNQYHTSTTRRLLENTLQELMPENWSFSP